MNTMATKTNRQMYCTKCGNRLTTNSSFCSKCGKKKGIAQKSDTNIEISNDKTIQQELPLQLQSQIKSLRTSAIIMVVISIISVYFIPWAVFYLILATMLKPKELPNRKLVKGAAIATLPLCLGLIPIIIDSEFWRMNRRLKEFEEQGSKAFISDEEFLAGEPKRKKRNIITWSILGSLVAILAIILIYAIVSNSSGTGSSNTIDSSVSSETPTPYTSSEHGFVVSFPGFPTTEHSNMDIQGVSVPITYYSKEINNVNNGNKAYGVQVIKYPASNFNLSGQERGALDGGINGMAQISGYKLINSSNNGTFLGYPSASATYTFSGNGNIYDVYSLSFLKGNDLYILLTVGEGKIAFDNFVNSFKFQ